MIIEFIEDSHTYVVDGMVTPSVTTLIHSLWMKDQYHGIPERTLKQAAAYGDKVHGLIEYWNNKEEEPDWFDRKSYEGIALRRYQKLQSQHDIKAIMQEQPVAYEEDGVPLFAGKFDMYGEVDGEPAIVDFKTTSKYYPEYLTYQLTLYKLALKATYDIDVEKAYCLWLPKKHLGNLIKVSFYDAEKLLRDIRQWHIQNQRYPMNDDAF